VDSLYRFNYPALNAGIVVGALLMSSQAPYNPRTWEYSGC